MESATMDVLTCAKYLGIGKNKMYALARSEGFPAIKVGNRTIIPVKALDDWLNRSALEHKQIEY